jgi:hypothetical protein
MELYKNKIKYHWQISKIKKLYQQFRELDKLVVKLLLK